MGSALLAFGAAGSAWAADTTASSPANTTLALYDRGFALVSEMRRVTLAAGENVVRFTGLPAQLDPASVSFTPLSGAAGLEVHEQQYGFDLVDVGRLFDRYLGRDIQVEDGGATVDGTLLRGPSADDADRPVTVQTREGEAVTFLAPASLRRVTFPGAADRAFLEPTLLWRAEAESEGPQNLRLSYVAAGVKWSAHYECMLGAEGAQALVAGRVAIENGSGGSFDGARVKLVVTEKGNVPPLVPGAEAVEARRAAALRYAYGAVEPTFERQAASAGTVETYDLARPLSIGPGETRHVQLFQRDAVPVRRFYVYDGVRFDRFQRHRRNDWNYGTESHQTVETHLEFDNAGPEGLGVSLPPGLFRLYQRGEGDTVDLVGEDHFVGVSTGATAHVVLGPARGLEGERERIGYTEVTPLHEYEESFEIRLANLSTEEVEIRVVEHLYRWPECEVVRADAEYQQMAPQAIEFRALVKPAGRRSIHYTVRYSW